MTNGLFEFLIGSSFANVGSAAQEIRGTDAGVVLPHNSYVELFLAGGLFMLSIVLFLQARALRTLWVGAINHARQIDRCLLVLLIILSCWMLGYPVIYEPVTGSLFWIIIGYGNRVQRIKVSSNVVLEN